MAIKTACPSCGTAMSVPDHFAGRSGRCRHCGISFKIPSGASSPSGEAIPEGGHPTRGQSGFFFAFLLGGLAGAILATGIGLVFLAYRHNSEAATAPNAPGLAPDAPRVVAARQPRVKAEVPRPNPSFWTDSRGSIWSMRPIPLLYGVPDPVKSMIPPDQGKLVRQCEDFLTIIERGQNSANALARRQIIDRVNSSEEEYFQELWGELKDRGIHGWVGQMQFDPTGAAVHFRFGRSFDLRISETKVIDGQDVLSWAYCSANPLYMLSFERGSISETAQDKLKHAREMQWLKVYASLKPTAPVEWVAYAHPKATLEDGEHSAIKMGTIQAQYMKLDDIQLID